jgi:hypothetical protein
LVSKEAFKESQEATAVGRPRSRSFPVPLFAVAGVPLA